MFGGAFDPPHWAHRALAETALTQLGLDVLHVLPTGHAWHKARVLSPAEHRVVMCERAFAGLPNIRLDQREIHRAGPTYTADTLRELAATGMTIFLVEQNANHALRLSDRAYVMVNGEIRLSGTGSLDGSAQKIDLTVQSIPAAALARVVFAAPDALADNIVVVNKTEVRNYLYLTNQITVTSAAKAAGQAGMTGLDFSQISNFSALLKNYDVKVVGTSGSAGNRLFTLEGTPRANGTDEGRARVYVTEAGWRPTRLQLLDGAGKVRADLNVTNYKQNSGLSAAKLTTLPRDAEIIMICRSGARSERAGQFLIDQGYGNVSNLTGGTMAWVQDGLPTGDDK